MVAFKAAQSASFIRAPDTQFAAALVYGPDAALVAERARELARQFARIAEPGAEIIRLDDRDLAEAPERLTIELQTQSMFTNARVVHVRAERRLRPDELETLIEGDLAAFLIVEAGNLRPSSRLRKVFEASQRAAALPCYSDPAREMGPLVERELAACDVRISTEACDYLNSKLGSDVALARSECVKLATYAGPGGEITVEDIDAIIGDIGAGLLDALTAAAADGRTRAALRQLDALIAAGQSPQTALAALSRHFQRLHRLCAAVEAGEPAKTAIAKFRPPVHFKQRDALLAQSRKWSERAAAQALQRVQETTKAARLTPGLEAEQTERLVIALSRGQPISY